MYVGVRSGTSIYRLQDSGWLSDEFQMLKFWPSCKLCRLVTYAQHFIRLVSKCSESETYKVRAVLKRKTSVHCFAVCVVGVLTLAKLICWGQFILGIFLFVGIREGKSFFGFRVKWALCLVWVYPSASDVYFVFISKCSCLSRFAYGCSLILEREKTSDAVVWKKKKYTRQPNWCVQTCVSTYLKIQNPLVKRAIFSPVIISYRTLGF